MTYDSLDVHDTEKIEKMEGLEARTENIVSNALTFFVWDFSFIRISSFIQSGRAL